MNRRTLLALLLPLCALTSCKDMTKAKGLADAAITVFHQQFNEQKFKELYTESHPDMKAAATEADFLKFLETLHQKLGKQVSSTEAGWRVNSLNFKTTAALTRNTEFEHGKGVENFTFVVSDGTCKLQSYFINSPALVAKEPDSKPAPAQTPTTVKDL